MYMEYVNLYGAAMFVLLMIPNIVWAAKNKDAQNNCDNKLMNVLEQVGRYGSFVSLVLNFGIFRAGFRSNESFALWLIVSGALLAAYYVCWAAYFKGKNVSLALALLPSALFVFGGIMERSVPLLVFGAIFTVAHVYVTRCNNPAKEKK